jgi:hypothetical protein
MTELERKTDSCEGTSDSEKDWGTRIMINNDYVPEKRTISNGQSVNPNSSRKNLIEHHRNWMTRFAKFVKSYENEGSIKSLDATHYAKNMYLAMGVLKK